MSQVCAPNGGRLLKSGGEEAIKKFNKIAEEDSKGTWVKLLRNMRSQRTIYQRSTAWDTVLQ